MTSRQYVLLLLLLVNCLPVGINGDNVCMQTCMYDTTTISTTVLTTTKATTASPTTTIASTTKEATATSISTGVPTTSIPTEAPEIYYDGNRPEPHRDVYSTLRTYEGIQVRDFGGLPEVDLCTIDQMDSIHSCYANCGNQNYEMDKVDCSCDSACYFYNDCCVDYEILCVVDWKPTISITDDVTFTTTTTSASMAYSTSDGANVTTDPKTTTQEPYYIGQHNEAFDNMDLLRVNIPQVVAERDIDSSFAQYQTCFKPKYDTVSYYMVTSCPDDSSEDEHNNCSDTKSDARHFSPIYSYTDEQFYANKFCAACHGHTNHTQLKYLSLSCIWICHRSESVYQEDAPKTLAACQESECFTLKWTFDHEPPRECDADLITNCSFDSGSAISRACHSYTAPVYQTIGWQPDHMVKYKNVHCAQCNGINDTWNPVCRTFMWGAAGGGDFVLATNGDTGGVPLTVLFDFTGGSLQASDTIGGPPPPLDCQEHFQYDRNSHVCRRVSCPSGSVLINGQCLYLKDPSQLTNRTLGGTSDPFYRKVVVEFLRRDDNVTDKQILSLMQDIMNSFLILEHYTVTRYYRADGNAKQGFLVWDGEAWKKSIDILQEENECVQQYRYGFILTIEGTVRDWAKSIDQYTYRLESWLAGKPNCQPNFDTDFALVILKYSNIPDITRLCNSSILVPKPYGDQSVTRVQIRYNMFEIHMQFPDNKTEIFESADVAQEIVYTSGDAELSRWNHRNGIWSRLDRVYLCETAPFCSLITLTTNEYEWKYDENGTASLVLTERGRIVPNNEIVLTDDGQIQICFSDDDDYEPNILYHYSSGQSLATTIGCVISLTLLALVILTYCTFSTLRNTPGKTVLNLSSSLFIAQLLLLAGAGQTANGIVCLTIACVMHFFWLSVFSWTNILAFDLARTFGKKSSMRNDSGSLFLKYSIYGWGIPLTLVTATVVLHFFQDIEGMIGNLYGITQACWLRGGYPVLIAFGVPVAIALIINVMFFVQTVHGIRSTMKMAKILKKDHEENDDLEFLKKELNLYIRLSISVGLTWISGFIILYTGVLELGYLFIILNSLQGPVIFLSFICSRRVMKLWSGKLGNSVYSGTSSIGGSSTISRTMQTHAAHSGAYGNNV